VRNGDEDFGSPLEGPLEVVRRPRGADSRVVRRGSATAQPKEFDQLHPERAAAVVRVGLEGQPEDDRITHGTQPFDLLDEVLGKTLVHLPRREKEATSGKWLA
jgi:hypothetical protein